MLTATGSMGIGAGRLPRFLDILAAGEDRQDDGRPPFSGPQRAPNNRACNRQTVRACRGGLVEQSLPNSRFRASSCAR